MEAVAQIGAKVSEVKDSAEALAHAAGKRLDAAGRKLDDVRAGTADALHTAATTIRTTGKQSAGVISGLTSGTADKLDAAGNFLARQRLRKIPENLRGAVRRNPTGSVIVAAALGFLAATAFRAMTHTCHPDNHTD